MKRLIPLLLLCVSSLFASIGEISALHGNAFILRDGKTIPIMIKTKIEEKDTIKTAKATKLQIIFDDNTIISLGQKSSFQVQEYLFSKTKVKARFNVKGLFKSITGKIGHIAPKNFKLKTQNATIGVRGTTIIGESTKTADTIICSSGEIVVNTPKGEAIVHMGERTIVYRGHRPTRPTIIQKTIIQKREQKVSIPAKVEATISDTPQKIAQLVEPVTKEIANVKEEKEDWGIWDKVDASKGELDERPVATTPKKDEPSIEVKLPQLAKLREKAGVTTATYRGKVAGFVDTPMKKISDGNINLNVDLGRGKVDGDIGFSQGSERWQANIKDGSVDRNGAIDFGISNDSNLKGAGDGMLSGEKLEHANGTFKIKNETNNQNAYGTFKARR